MNRNKWLSIIMIILAFALNAKGQELRGTVTDRHNVPIDMASVIIKDAKGKPVAFSHTEETGQFRLTSAGPQDGKTLEISSIGYKTYKCVLKDYRNDSKIRMEEDKYTLKEVQVRPDKITQNGDTLTYNVAAFKQKQDRSIADVIKKMPGLEVAGDGSISFQGKAINKFYVEGMDLMGNKYSQVSENLNANKVAKVQVLQNHQPIKSLRNVNFSDQAALNIVLNDDARNVWQGIVDVGAGHSAQGKAQWTRNERLMAMFFSRHMQSVTMYKSNNTGKDIEHEIRDLAASKTDMTEDQDILSNIQLTAPSINEERYKFNDSRVFATNWLFKTKAGNDLRLQASGFFDRDHQQQQSVTTLMDVNDGNAVITEDAQALVNRSELKLETEYKVNKDAYYLDNKLKGYLDFNYSHATTTLNGKEVLQNVEPRKRYITDRFEMIRTLQNKQSLSLTSQLSYNYSPGTLLLHDGGSESLGLHSLRWNTSAYFRHQLAGYYLTYRMGADISDQHLALSNNSVDTTNVYRQYTLYFMPSMTYSNTSLHASLAVKLSARYRQYDSRHAWNFIAEPSLSMNYALTSFLKTSLSYAYVWTPYTIDYLSASPIYLNYITLMQGRGVLDENRIHVINNSWTYTNAIHGFTANVGINYNGMNHVPLYCGSYTDGYYKRIQSDETGNSNVWKFNGRITKALGWGLCSIALTANYRISDYQMIYDQAVEDCHLNSVSAGIEVAFHPIDFFSIEEQSHFNHYKQRLPYSSSTLAYFDHSLSLFFMPGKWQLQWLNELYHSNDKSVNTNFYSDLTLSYREKSYEIGISCNNIFGTTEYRRRDMTELQQIYSVTHLRPREFMVKVCLYL